MNVCGKLVVITGPSGVGKSTIVRQALERTGAQFSVSATTRQPRAGETDGREYRFVDTATFEAMIERGELLEWAKVYGQYYGTPAADVLAAIEAGRTVILEIDVEGGKQVHAKAPDATFVLIAPPSADILAQRLAGRASETPEQLQQRLGKADEEIAAAEACGVYNHRVINDDLEQAIQQVAEIIERETGVDD